MPEYLALSHFHERSQKSENGDGGKEWTADDLDAAFIRAERSGALRIN